MSTIALLTDFSLHDEFVGVMKGVILSITPNATIIDLCHEIPPQSILQGALMLQRSYRFFPKGTIFCCVVDPGVGTQRNPIAARAADWYFVGPDNGLFSPVFQEIAGTKQQLEVFNLDQPNYWMKEISKSFHGRDIFAPVAAHLSKGVKITELGRKTATFVKMDLPEYRKTQNGWEGSIINIDHFGNCSSNLPSEVLKENPSPRLLIKQHLIDKFVNTFGEAQPGEVIIMADSSGYLSICMVDGNAQKTLDLHFGDKVELMKS